MEDKDIAECYMIMGGHSLLSQESSAWRKSIPEH